MKDHVLSEKKYRLALNSTAQQRKYIMALVAELNNSVIDPANSPGEKNRAAQNIIQALKVLTDIERCETLKELDERLKKVESKGR
jgi:hypothetical protein